MKGAVLAGGLGSRLYPLSHATNKHLLPVYDKPMVYYPIQTLVKAGIKDIMVVTGGPHAGDFIRVLQNGKNFGIDHLEYAYQERGDGGIADALKLCEDFADGGPLTVILGDNTTNADIGKEVKNFRKGAVVFLKKISDQAMLKRLGVAVFDKDSKLLTIEEKPEKPKSNYVQTGLYIYDAKVFSHIGKLKPSKRGQLEVTDLNNIYLKNGELTWRELKGFWLDAGTFESLYLANTYWARKKNNKAHWENLLKNSKE